MRKKAAETIFPVLFLCFLCAVVAGTALAKAQSEFSRAEELFSAQKFDQALLLYQRMLAVPLPGVPAGDIHSRIGDSHFRLGNYPLALVAYREADKDRHTSDRPRVQYWIGFCCFLIDKDAEAVREFLKVPERYPDASMWISTAYYWAAKASERMGRRDQAAEYYKKAGGNGKTIQGKFAMQKAEAAKEK